MLNQRILGRTHWRKKTRPSWMKCVIARIPGVNYVMMKGGKNHNPGFLELQWLICKKKAHAGLKLQPNN